MRVAPPVQALSCSTGPWLWLQQVLYGLAVFVAMYWGGSHLLADGGGGGVGPGSLLIALVVGFRAGHWLRRPARVLAWDGVAWSSAAPCADAQPGQASVMIDLGDWMLVRFTPASGGYGGSGGSGRQWPQWLALSGREPGPSWPALRVALHSLAPVATEQGAARRSLPVP